MGDIRKMFDPKSVAVFGDMEGEAPEERVLLANLLLSDRHKTFWVHTQGEATGSGKKARKNARPTPLVVSPTGDAAFEVTSYPDIGSIPEKIDLAVVASAAPIIPGIVEDCGKAGVEGIVIVSGGFKEAGEEGTKLEEALREIRNRYRMRIVGPNRGSIIRPGIGLNTSAFDAQPDEGNIAFISQSESLARVVLDWAASAHVGFSMCVSLGSMVDVDFGDLIDFLGEDPKTRSIMIYMERVGNARKFMSAARSFARNKPIIVVKSGQFKESARASLSHTGSMAGYDAAYDVAFRRAGVVRVREIMDLFNAAEVLHSKNLPKGPALAIVTNAGGLGVMATDILIGLRGRLAQLGAQSVDEMDTFLPAHWSRSNPVDLFGDADIERYTRAVNVCLADPQVDGILVIYTSSQTAPPTELASAIMKIAEGAYKPVIVTWMGASSVQEGREALKENHIPVYETPEEAIKTYLYMYRYKRNLELLYETPAELPVEQSPPKNNLKAFIRRTLKEGRRILSEAESKNFLKSYGIPTSTPFMVNSADAAASWAERLGYPIVLKIVSPDILHRSDVGGMVAVHAEGRLKAEYDSLLERVREKAPGAAITGVTIEKMVEGVDYQLILGSKKDTDFGSIILFGVGGMRAETYRDVSFAIPPLNQTLARLLMEETELCRTLRDFSPQKMAAFREMEQIVVNFSNFVVDFPEIAEMDINPIVISKGKPLAVNARIVLEEGDFTQTVQYSHLAITPYPTRYVTHSLLPNGREVVLRPIKPEDEPLEHELLSSLSQATMRSRFFSIIKDISHEMLVRYCNIDYDREMAIVAEVRENEKRKLIGIGRLIIDREFKSGEFAVLVHDDHQGSGLGSKLVDMLIGVAEEKGLERMYGEVLTENAKMLAVCKKLGFIVETADEEITRVGLSLR
ncbi:MAG: bifunctional acetate--CoA ligase family protein/GNAT family N-acetyltransferase [Syntrophorhabdales bacterium]